MKTFPFGYLGQLADTVFFIVGIICFCIMLAVIAILMLILIKNYNKDFWKVSIKDNLLIISLIFGTIYWGLFKLILKKNIKLFGINDVFVTIWFALIILAILGGALVHSGIPELGSCFGLLLILIDLILSGNFTHENFASISILSFVAYLFGPYVSNRLIRGILNYSFATTVIFVRSTESFIKRSHEIINMIKETVESQYKQFKFKLGVQRFKESYAITDSVVYPIPLRFYFKIKGPRVVPLIHAIKGDIKQNSHFLPSAFSQRAIPHVSACIDSSLTLSVQPIIQGAITLSEKGFIIALAAFEETSTKRYVSRRIKKYLARLISTFLHL